MKALNKETAAKTQRPERIIQFGEGNFLRAFVDWIIYNMNEKTDFNSSVVVVQPIEKGMVDMLNAQDCLYHVNLQGLDKGQVVNSLTKIDVISRALNPYSQNDEFMKLAEQPEMRFVISNTTSWNVSGKKYGRKRPSVYFTPSMSEIRRRVEPLPTLPTTASSPMVLNSGMKGSVPIQ